MDENGNCNIQGRLKDMIIRGGENIYPREIEEFLYTHPVVRDIQVVGIPDEKYGEEVAAFIQTRNGKTPSEEEIREFCQDRISFHKIPRHIHFVNEFPTIVDHYILTAFPKPHPQNADANLKIHPSQFFHLSKWIQQN